MSDPGPIPGNPPVPDLGPIRGPGRPRDHAARPVVCRRGRANPDSAPRAGRSRPPRTSGSVPEGKAVVRRRARSRRSLGRARRRSRLQATGIFAEKSRRQTPPSWVGEAAPSTFLKEIGDQFVALLRPGRPILAEPRRGDGRPPEGRQTDGRSTPSARSGRWTWSSTVLRPEGRSDRSTGRSIEVLRSGLAQGGETAKSVREALVRQYDHPWSDVTEKLIVGFSPEESKDEATLAKLVEIPQGSRAEGLGNWPSTTSRPSPVAATAWNTTPTTPKGKGLKAWQDLVGTEGARQGRRSAGKSLSSASILRTIPGTQRIRL